MVKEKILWSGRPSLVWIIPQLSFVAFMMLVLLILSYVSYSASASPTATSPETLSKISLACLGLFLILALGFTSKVLDAMQRKYIIFNNRVFASVGLLSKSSTEVRAKDIRGIKLSQTFAERLFGIGTIAVSSAASGDDEVMFSGIHGAKKVADLIRDIQND